MGYFTKEQYEGKREYASKIAKNNKTILVNAGMLEVEADKIIRLSHLRHEIHSSKGEKLKRLFDELGHQYSADITLIDEVNTIAEKHGLPLIPAQEIPEIEREDDDYLIAEYFCISEEELEKNYNEYIEKINIEWEKSKDKTSHTIRSWFKKVNEKFKTDFPSISKNFKSINLCR